VGDREAAASRRRRLELVAFANGVGEGDEVRIAVEPLPQSWSSMVRLERCVVVRSARWLIGPYVVGALVLLIIPAVATFAVSFYELDLLGRHGGSGSRTSVCSPRIRCSARRS
jgi:hypothetical protein